MKQMKSKRIGILFIFKSRWLGGLYYLINVIKACNYLPSDEQPEIVVFYNQRTQKYLKEIDYSKVKFVEVDLDFDYKRYFKSFFLRRNFYFTNDFTHHNLDVLFPFNDFIGKTYSENIDLVSWIPDFQHKFYPQYFNKLNLFLRELKFKSIVKNSNGLILSSQSAVDHFKQFYPMKAAFAPKIVRFTSIFDVEALPSKEFVTQKYNTTREYFIVSNQFYVHKNHLIVLKALKELKNRGIFANILMTGRPNKSDDVTLINEIEDYIKANDLSDQVQLVGLLPREDQLALMKYAICVIQPSKFEGWSTVIEDAKTLKRRVIASNLDVHIEQLGDQGYFFDPENAVELASSMDILINGPERFVNWGELPERTERFARSFLQGLYSKI